MGACWIGSLLKTATSPAWLTSSYGASSASSRRSSSFACSSATGRGDALDRGSQRGATVGDAPSSELNCGAHFAPSASPHASQHSAPRSQAPTSSLHASRTACAAALPVARRCMRARAMRRRSRTLRRSHSAATRRDVVLEHRRSMSVAPSRCEAKLRGERDACAKQKRPALAGRFRVQF